MADENDAGAAYLAALKQSAAPRAAGATPAKTSAPKPASFPEARVGSGTPSARAGPAAEKRRTPRYKCQGSAQLRETDAGVATWATFSDISLHGCYVEATATYRVGVVLNLKLEANGFRIEATGDVRVAYPGLGMGISFTKIADEDRERLRGLVRSISQPSVIIGARAAERPPSSTQPNAVPAPANPGAVLQAILTFFEDRHVMGREEFLRILRKSQ
jgi:hypothetical protein